MIYDGRLQIGLVCGDIDAVIEAILLFELQDVVDKLVNLLIVNDDFIRHLFDRFELVTAKCDYHVPSRISWPVDRSGIIFTLSWRQSGHN